MGIKNFGVLFSDYLLKKHLDSFKEKTFGIDGMSWIYKGVYSSFDNELSPIEKIIQYYIKMIMVLKTYDIKPIIIFDGNSLEAKKELKNMRKLKKENYNNKTKSNENNDSLSKRRIMLYDLDYNDVSKVLYFLKEINVEYYVAPYEADAQLSYLYNENVIDFIVSEDYDIILYSVNNIIYKLTTKGDLLLYNSEEILNIMNGNMDIVKADKNINLFYNFLNFNLDQKIFTIIISGCDYTKGVTGLGLKKTISIINDLKSKQEIVNYINENKDKYKLNDYELANIINSYYCFTKQIVYHKEDEELVYFDNSTDNVVKQLGVDNIEYYIGKRIEEPHEFVLGKNYLKLLEYNEELKLLLSKFLEIYNDNNLLQTIKQKSDYMLLNMQYINGLQAKIEHKEALDKLIVKEKEEALTKITVTNTEKNEINHNSILENLLFEEANNNNNIDNDLFSGFSGTKNNSKESNNKNKIISKKKKIYKVNNIPLDIDKIINN